MGKIPLLQGHLSTLGDCQMLMVVKKNSSKHAHFTPAEDKVADSERHLYSSTAKYINDYFGYGAGC